MASSQQGQRHRATKTPPGTCYRSCTPGYLVLRQEWSSNNHLEPSLRSGPITQGSSAPSEIGACSICRMPREPLTNHRFVYCCQDGGKSLLDLATQLWMSEYVEFVLADRGEGTRSHLRRVEPGL
jgi:hypothetical protein